MTVKTSNRLSSKGEKANLKLASWNINGIRGWLTNGGLKYIEQEQPDMICFQVYKFFFFTQSFEKIPFRN
jgi:AP endonuclease-1